MCGLCFRTEIWHDLVVSGGQLSSFSSSVQDQVGDLIGMSDQREVASIDFDGRGIHSLRQEALKLWRDGSVLA
jgi:hypothetical protein